MAWQRIGTYEGESGRSATTVSDDPKTTTHTLTELPPWARAITDRVFYVGLIANNWAKLEHLMAPLANELLRTTQPEVGKLLIFALNPVARRDLFMALSLIGDIPDAIR